MDDHAAGDGREHVVTVPGLCSAEAMTSLMTGADISMFFSALPPGINGTPRAASGTVSYTHLRAHETVLDLVCRLLLEKKKK